MKHLVGKEQTKEVPFMGEKVEIRKLSISKVMQIRDVIEASKGEADQMEVLRSVLRISVVGAEEMTEEDFNGFPPADLNELAEGILEYCGIAPGAEVEGNSLPKKK